MEHDNTSPLASLPPLPPSASPLSSFPPEPEGGDITTEFSFSPPLLPETVPVIDTTASPFQRFWRKFGGDGFLVSVGVHAALLTLALTWIVSVTLPPSSKPEDFSPGQGGGNGGSTVNMTIHRVKPKNASNMLKTPSKIVSKSSNASVSLPDMPNLNMAALQSGSLAGASSKGLGGGGGGGIGPGIGPGRGGGRNMVSPFGMNDISTPGLVGVFYDFKQDPKGNFKDPGIPQYVALVRSFMKSGWSEHYLRSRFFSAPERLVLTHVFIPVIPADEAPKAYNVADKVKPSRWMAHYKGSVKAPITGRFRFVGTADDWIVVRWGGRAVLDSGYDIVAQSEKHKGPPFGVEDIFPSQLPVPMRCGPWINATKGTDYAFEVAIGETPGGVFYAYLCYETEKERGKLKLFRMDSGELSAQIKAGDPRIPDVDMSGGGVIWAPKMQGSKPLR
jgi:hypothetical protein